MSMRWLFLIVCSKMETNGVVLRYELSGEGQELLFLIHELGGSLDFWDPLMPALQPVPRW